LICDIALKISTRPRERRTLLIPVETIEQGLQFGEALVRVALTASAIILCRGRACPDYELASASSEDYLLERELVSQCNYVLVYTAEGMSEDVRAELAQVRGLLATLQARSTLETERIIGSQFWANVLGARSEDSIVVRTGVPIQSLSEYVQE